jgi:hypothetical protein
MATTVRFDDRHYVPILKGKDGEYGALRELGAGARARTTPLIELAPPEGPLENVIDRFARFATNWRERLFVDDLRVPPTARTAGGASAAEHALNVAQASGLAVIPVTGVDRGAAHHATTQAYAVAAGSGTALRVTFGQARAATFAADVAQTLKALQLTPTDVDLIVDLAAIDPAIVDVLGAAVASVVNALPHLNEWRTLTVASSAFPANLSGFTGVTTAPRGDWALWQAVRATPPTRQPSYGDYGVESPGFFDYAPYMVPSAAIRYTATDDWLIVRGTSVRGGAGFAQFRGLAQTLAARSEFSGRNFSWGDRFIDDCAGGGGPGNLTTWRKVGMNHHIELVATQVAAVP